MKKYRLLVFLSALLISNVTVAGFFEEKKNINCAYKVSSKPSIEVDNKYGEVQIIGWEKDSVKLEATIIATSDKLQDIQKLMGKVNVVCRGTESTVIFSTEWTDGVSFLNKGSMDLKNLLNSDKKLIVNYKVYLPTNSRLSINNHFGDVYLPNFTGPLRIDMAHGDLRARDIKDARSISVRYGKVLIKSLEQGLLKMEYSSIILDKANILTLESKSSTIEILEANRLAIKSKSDELRLDKVTSLRGQATYSNIMIKELKELVNLTTSYGDLSIRGVSNEFRNIQLKGSSTDYDIEFAEDAKFQISVDAMKEKGISHSPLIKLTTDGSVINDVKKYNGYLGSEEAASRVEIVQKSGYLNLYVR